jgi:hypothetical protein
MPSRKATTAQVDDPQEALPTQPVDKPILCSPYVEPEVHQVYDQSTGVLLAYSVSMS